MKIITIKELELKFLRMFETKKKIEIWEPKIDLTRILKIDSIFLITVKKIHEN